jgi:hypothetical protein
VAPATPSPWSAAHLVAWGHPGRVADRIVTPTGGGFVEFLEGRSLPRGIAALDG